MTAAVLVMAATVAACSSGGSQGASKAGAGDAKSFTYWSMWTEDEAQAAVIKEALASYKAATGVTVTVEWHGRGVLDDIAAAIKAGKPVPDLSDSSVNTVLGEGAEGVDVADLTSLYQQPVPGENQNLADVVPDKYMPLMTATSGAVVLVPYEVASEAVFFDKTKYPQLSTSPPQTWDQFMALLEQIKGDGQVPLALDATGGNAAYWVEWMFERELGPGQFKRTARSGTPPTPAWTAAGTTRGWPTARRSSKRSVKGGDSRRAGTPRTPGPPAPTPRTSRTRGPRAKPR